MALDITPPMIIANRLTWGVQDATIPDLTFSVSVRTFKLALGLRPRAAAANAIANDIAHQNWAVLELIAREAEAEGGIIATHNHNGWQINHTIDDAVFRKSLKRRWAQVVMPHLRR
jgi:predicted transcriptional regulator